MALALQHRAQVRKHHGRAQVQIIIKVVSSMVLPPDSQRTYSLVIPCTTTLPLTMAEECCQKVQVSLLMEPIDQA